MHLEKIEITGFKSFADKTVLRFDMPITAIVGPNGCGKSNIVDAFRWVLGEGSAKSLRSDKMIDVIFSGASTRKPLNYAQISLTFTQIDKTLSLDYEELCITRRIHRNGDSEWYINRNPVRLKDVHKILWEAGIGKNAFYIFEQGKVDELITSSPLERRAIFEEAAKIMHFKEKKKEALRKLSQVEGNLKRVLDIQAEVNQQIETLQKQAEEARIYAANKRMLSELERGLLVYKWQHNHKKLAQEQTLSEENQRQQKQSREDTENLEKELQALKDSHVKKAQEARLAYEAFFELKKAGELASFEFNSHNKKKEELQKQIQLLKDNLQQLHQRHLREHRTFEENQEHLKAHEHDVHSLSTHLQKINGTLNSLEQRVEEETRLRKEAQQKLMTVVSSENQQQSLYKNNTLKLRSNKEKLANLLHQEKSCLTKMAEKETEYESLLKLQESLAIEFEKEDKELNALEVGFETKKVTLRACKEEIKELSKTLTQNRATFQLLSNLKNEHEGYNQSSKKLLQAASDSNHPLYEKVFPLTDWFQPKNGFEAHLSTILQPYLQTLVVHTDKDLETLRQEAEKQNLQSFSCLSLEKIPQSSVQELEVAKENPVSCHFLGSLGKHEDLNFISKDYYCDHLGIYHHIAFEDQNLFLREVELKKIEKELIVSEKAHEKRQQELALFAAEVEEIEKKQVQLSRDKQKHELELAKLDFSIKKGQEELKNLKENSLTFESQKNELSQSIADLEAEQKELVKLCESEESSRREQENYFSKIEAQFEENFSALKEKRSLKQSLEDKVKKLEKDSQALKESIRVFESKSLSFEDQIKEMNQSIHTKQQDHQDLEKQDALFQKKKSDFHSQLQTAEKEYHDLENELKAIEANSTEHEKKLKEMRESLNLLRNSEVELKGKLSEIQAEINLQTEEIEEKLEVSRDEISSLEVDDSITLGKTEKEIRRLRRELESQPEINLKAISDCEAQKSRFEFLQSQVNDLLESQEKLLEIITKLDDTSRQMFQETFEKIRERFRENFLLLFNGGEADLKLGAHEDILDAGIDIIAQPPGKKMRSIQLLSGGEKCLCAIALLFALFETQSIPFCILDEIDAPLDDTNIERFTNVLKQFVKNNQFIIITHNKRTMAIADNLLGVSMQEKGVTKIIPLEFSNTSSEAAV